MIDHLDRRRPVIIGVGQHTQRTAAGAEVLEPAALLARAARVAIDDTGARIDAVDSVRLIRSVSARAYRNAPALIATFAGLRAREHVVVEGGGETPGAALVRACDDIATGARRSVLLVAGEAWYSATQAQRRGASLEVTTQSEDTPPPDVHGALIEFVHPAEEALGITRPIHQYPLFEQALRAHLGHSIAQHQAHLGALMARFSEVAVANPDAWDRTAHTADQIATPSPTNRFVGSPYTKLMVSNEQVDMAAAMARTGPLHWVEQGAGPNGETDEVGHKAAVNVVTPNDYQATIFHLLGLDPANWPEHHTGWGELPEAAPTWSAFWGPDAPRH